MCLPWVIAVSNTGKGKQPQFGALWNVPAFGSAHFGSAKPSTQSWVATDIDQADLFITTFAKGSDPATAQASADLLSHYVDATGHAPPLPTWAAGYWHSKNRYSTQQQVLDTMATMEKNYSIPVAVFVIDYFNWAVMGNLTFNPANWPDPQSMVDTLKAYGTKIMVSTWPFSQGNSKTYVLPQPPVLSVACCAHDLHFSGERHTRAHTTAAETKTTISSAAETKTTISSAAILLALLIVLR